MGFFESIGASACWDWFKKVYRSRRLQQKIYQRFIYPCQAFWKKRYFNKLLRNPLIKYRAQEEEYMNLLKLAANASTMSLLLTCLVPPTWFKDDDQKVRLLKAYDSEDKGKVQASEKKIKERIVILKSKEIIKLFRRRSENNAKKLSEEDIIQWFHDMNPNFTIYWACKEQLEKRLGSEADHALIEDYALFDGKYLLCYDFYHKVLLLDCRERSQGLAKSLFHKIHKKDGYIGDKLVFESFDDLATDVLSRGV